MIQKSEDLKKIMENLSILIFYIKFSSEKLGLHDINKSSESFFCELFNILLNTSFERTETKKGKNFVAIDLFDDCNFTAMQITSDGSNEKLSTTLEKFKNRKLYEKYKVLYHFVIGEKHYNHRSKLGFTKDNFNMYVKIFEEHGISFEVRLIDMFDLLPMIDANDAQKVHEVYEYIRVNIKHPIDSLISRAYGRKDSVKKIVPFTANSFIKHLKIEEDQKDVVKKDLSELNNVLLMLEKKTTRKFLYTAIHLIDYEGGRTKNLEFDPLAIKRILGMTDQELDAEMRILVQLNLIDKNSWEYNNVCILSYSDSVGDDLLRIIYSYCILKRINIEKVFYDVDFSLLD